jgi:hypothetical protein
MQSNMADCPCLPGIRARDGTSVNGAARAAPVVEITRNIAVSLSCIVP